MAISGILQEIDRLKSELDRFRPLTEKQVLNLKRLFDVDFTYNSTAIEGNTFTLQEMRVVLLDGITIGGKSTREHLEIVNHKEAIDFIERLAGKNREEFQRSDIFNIHYLVLKGIDPENDGTYRNSPVHVRLKDGGTHKFTDPLRVQEEMDQFFAWFSSARQEHPVLLAAEAHTRFVNIHPFVDGNGRTARLLMNLVLLHHGFPPAVIKAKDRIAYLDALEDWQQHQDKHAFHDLLTQAVLESLQLYLETLTKGVIWT